MFTNDIVSFEQLDPGLTQGSILALANLLNAS